MRMVNEAASTSFLILSWGTFTAARSINLRSNPLGLDYEPAPSPEDGPPLSAGALRDPAYLPAEISGIVGAYIFVVAVVGIALFTVGRQLRKATTRPRKVPDVELTQPPIANPAKTHPYPLSPTSQNFSRPSPEKADQNPYIFPSLNSQDSSRPSLVVDTRVVEADRQHMNKGLEDIYAHVMAHEEAKAASGAASSVSLPQPPLSPLPMQRQPLPSSSPQRSTKISERPRLSTTDSESRGQKTQSRASSLMSSLSRKKGGIRSMQISSPILTPLSQTFSVGYASDEEPLSPIHYKPPPPPPVPKDQEPYAHSRNNSSHTNGDVSPTSSRPSVDEQLQLAQTTSLSKPASISKPAPPPFPIQPIRNPLAANPARRHQNLDINANATATPSNNPTPAPSNPPSNNNSTRTLPFRAFDPPAGLTSVSAQSITKTTVLERRGPTSLLSPGSKTPFTAGAVPYSPYQPQTPLMPYTPTLVTRRDRKMMKKLEGRGPALEMIKSEEDMWDSGY